MHAEAERRRMRAREDALLASMDSGVARYWREYATTTEGGTSGISTSISNTHIPSDWYQALQSEEEVVKKPLTPVQKKALI